MYRSRRNNKLNEHGYTLLEALFHFVVFLLLTQFIVLLISGINQRNSTFFENKQIQWEMFVSDFRKNLNDIEEITVTDDAKEIIISKRNEEEKIQINQYNGVIRKQVNRKGHVPLLIGIKKVNFSFEQSELKINVEFINGLKKERTFFVQLYEE